MADKVTNKHGEEFEVVDLDEFPVEFLNSSPRWFVIGRRVGADSFQCFVARGPFENHAEAILNCQECCDAYSGVEYTLADIRFRSDYPREA